jgi:predicted dehydrogenase
MQGSADSRPLRIAVAGVGSFSQRVLIPGLVACPHAEVVALFGPTREKTERIARERGIPRAYADYERMLDESEPEAVVIATPNDVHYPMVMAALARRLHVLCEKPLGVNVAQAREMAAAARAAGVRTAVNFTYRSTNPMRHLARLIEQGRLGTLYHFSISFWQNLRTDAAAPLAYRMLRERGGGALLDIGVHLADLIRWWFGEIEAVCGVTHIAIGERPAPSGGRGRVTADDTASFVVRLPSGVAGTVQVSQVATGRQNYRRVELFGSHGALMMEEDRTVAPVVRAAGPGEPALQVEPLPDDLNVAFDDFPRFHLTRIVAALRGEPNGWPTFADGLRAQQVVEAVEQSWQTERWIRLQPPDQ